MRMTLFVTLLMLSGVLAYAESNPISPGSGVNKSVGLSGTTAPTFSNLIAGLRGDTINGGNTIVPFKAGPGGEMVTITTIVTDNIVAPMDGGLLDASTIQGSAGAFLQVVASMPRDTKKIRVHSTTGIYVGVYEGPAASETFVDSFGPGADYEFPAKISAGSRVSLRSMETVGGGAGDLLFMDFLE